MINEKAFEKIKNAIINIDGKDYIKIKKDTLKSLGYHYNIFTKTWTRTKFEGMVCKLKIKATKIDKNTYLTGINLDSLNKPLMDMFAVPYIAELVDVKEDK